MRYHHERRPMPITKSEQQVNDRRTIGFIQITRWFVGQQQLGP
jgi:hypothetical protein